MKEAGFPICGRLPVGLYEICWDDCDGGLYARCDGSGTSALCRREQGDSVSAGRAVKQRCAACMPFDRMAQAEWESEHESPHCLSHWLSPHAQGKVFLKLCARSPNTALRLPAGEPQRGAGPAQNYTSGMRRITCTGVSELVKSSVKLTVSSSSSPSSVSSASVPSSESRQSA